MTIPNVRIESITTYGGEQIENPFYEGNLNDDDKNNLKWYDFGIEDSKGFFNNYQSFDFEVEGEDIDLRLFLNNHPKILERLIENFTLYIEQARNNTVVGLIEVQNG